MDIYQCSINCCGDVRDSRTCDVEYFRGMRSYKIIEGEARCWLSLGRITARFLMMGKGVIHHNPVFIEFHLQFLGAQSSTTICQLIQVAGDYFQKWKKESQRTWAVHRKVFDIKKLIPRHSAAVHPPDTPRGSQVLHDIV